MTNNQQPYPDEPPAYLDASPMSLGEESPFSTRPDWAIEAPPAQVAAVHHNGHAASGHTTNGHSNNGHRNNGHSSNGHSQNGHSNNGHSSSNGNSTHAASSNGYLPEQPKTVASVLKESHDNGYMPSPVEPTSAHEAENAKRESTADVPVEVESVEQEPLLQALAEDKPMENEQNVAEPVPVNVAVNVAVNGADPEPAPAPLSEASIEKNGATNGQYRNSVSEPKQNISRLVAALPTREDARQLYITFRRTGSTDRDKFRLKELYERVYNPRGHDQFMIRLDTSGQQYELAFPNDPCQINERLVSELEKHFRVEVEVKEL